MVAAQAQLLQHLGRRLRGQADASDSIASNWRQASTGLRLRVRQVPNTSGAGPHGRDPLRVRFDDSNAQLDKSRG
jgi:hypothetical protein